MKQYIKDNQIKRRHEIVLCVDGIYTYNPSEEMVLSNGWSEVINPESSAINPIDVVRVNKKREIEEYDISTAVNEFYINGKGIWLDKLTRAGLLLRFQSEQIRGKEYTTLWYDNEYFELPIEDAQNMLYSLEVYASECYDNTQKHLTEINKLATIEEIEEYDYRDGYPEKLSF